jgi:hypothetical protein
MKKNLTGELLVWRDHMNIFMNNKTRFKKYKIHDVACVCHVSYSNDRRNTVATR